MYCFTLSSYKIVWQSWVEMNPFVSLGITVAGIVFMLFLLNLCEGITFMEWYLYIAIGYNVILEIVLLVCQIRYRLTKHETEEEYWHRIAKELSAEVRKSML